MPIHQATLRDRWLAQQQYAETTKATYRETLSAFGRRFPCFAERVTEAMLIDFLTCDANGEPTSRAPSTLNRQRSTLRAFWRWANRSGYVKVDPALHLDELHLGTGQRRPGRWLTRDEAQILLRSTDDGTDQGLRDHTLILLGLLTGLRRSELVGLRWRDIDLANARATVKGKGAKFGTVGLPAQALEGLVRWQRRTLELCGRHLAPNAPVFPTGRTNGGLLYSARGYTFDFATPITKWTARGIVARRAQEAGLGTVATHDLRRSFAGFLDSDGTDLQGIQAALRHSSPGVTAQCYLDPSPRRAIEATAALWL